MSGNWYVQSGGSETGPLSDNQLRAMAAEGQLSLFSSVRKGQSGDWVLARNVRGLFQPSSAVKTSAADLPSPDPPPAPDAAASPTSAHSSAERTNGAKRSSLITCPDCGANISRSASSCPTCGKPFFRPNRYVAIALALFLGGVGAHKFYLKYNKEAILYLLFCWTFIPAILGIVDGIRYLALDDEAFAAQHGTASGSGSKGSIASSSVLRTCPWISVTTQAAHFLGRMV